MYRAVKIVLWPFERLTVDGVMDNGPVVAEVVTGAAVNGISETTAVPVRLPSARLAAVSTTVCGELMVLGAV